MPNHRWAFLYSYTAETFADALNTVQAPKATGAVGIVPSYGIGDMNLGLRVSKNIDLKWTINNCTNKQYFTKRPLFYPGPGIWSSDGRNATLTIAVKL